MKDFKKLFYPVVVLIILIFMTGCRAPKELVYRDFKNFQVGKLGFTTSSVKMDLVYYNPNNFGLQLNRTDLDIFINNNYLGHTVQDMQITIPRLAEFSLPISMDVDMKNIFKNALNTLLKNEVTVKVTGQIRVGKANVFKSFPVNYEGKQTFSLF